MARKKNGTEHWRDELDRQARSGLSVREFCAQAGVSQASFYAWRRRFAESANGAGETRKGSIPVEAPGNGGPFIPLKLLDAASALELVHPLGYQIRVTGDVNVHGLRQVLELLDERRVR
jgi:transposase-like protein